MRFLLPVLLTSLPLLPAPQLPVQPQPLARTTTAARPQPAFQVVPLGVKGGLDESNLSAYLVGPVGGSDFVCLDAGTVQAGVRRAIRRGSLKGPAEDVVRQHIRAYCLSHPHLDHVAGLLLNAPDDLGPKPVLGLPGTLQVLQRDYLNWQAWPNFGDAGPAPSLRRYQLTPLPPGAPAELPLPGCTVQAFPLSHGPGYTSTAFLLRHGPAALLYLGDTGADVVEGSTRLRELWQAVAPLLRTGELRGIFLECSYPNEQPEKQLFGHLTPRLLLQELGTLGELAGPAALRGLPVIVTHLKPTAANEATIRRQLQAGTQAGLRLIFPEQGRRLTL